MFNQQIPDVERRWFQTVSANARRLHDDALKLFRADSFSSSIVISTYALEEMGKLISFEPLEKPKVPRFQEHKRKQAHLVRSSIWLSWALAVSRILNRPLPSVMQALDSASFDLELLMAYPTMDKLDLATLDIEQKDRFDEIWLQLGDDKLFQFVLRFGTDTAPKLTEIRHASLYVDHKDGNVSNPLHGSKELAWQLIEDTKMLIELIDAFVATIAEHEAKLASPG